MFEQTIEGFPVRVDDLDAEWLLELASEAEAAEWRAGRSKLRLAAQWCVLHPATSESGVASWGDTGIPGMLDCDESLGGEGTPGVAAFTPEPFAAALGVSTSAGMQLLADALDLQHRLPRIWGRVERLEVAPWKARRAAQATHRLSQEAAGAVDRELAGRIASAGPVAIARMVASAAVKHDPEAVAKAEDTGREGWGVNLCHGAPGEWAGTSRLEATGDTLDLTRFHDLVCEQAAALKALGDTDSLEVRKAKALGVIADQQATLDLHALNGNSAAGPSVGERVENTRPTRRTKTPAKSTLFVHMTWAELLGLDDGPGLGVGEVERLGPATIARIKEWLGHSWVTVQPVLDRQRNAAVDEHDPPAWMRELVILRDRHCVFPWCGRDARSCDIDHIDPYGEDGPPGQTRPENLAPLCRRHHRAKTAGRWRYRRSRDGTYLWHAPHGRTYLVTPTGTLEVHPN